MKRTILCVAILVMAFSGMPQAETPKQVYLSPFIGDGTRTNAFRPHCVSEPGGDYIDIRPNNEVSSGWAICTSDALPVQAGIVPIASSLNATITPANRLAVNAALGIVMTATTVEELISELLITHAKTDGTKWKPLKKSKDGKYHIYLGHQQIFEQTAWLYPSIKDHGYGADLYNLVTWVLSPSIAWAVTFTESWDCPNSDNLSCNLTWTEYLGTAWRIVGNEAFADAGGAGTRHARAESDASTSDTEATATVTTFVKGPGGNFSEFYVYTRKDSSSTSTFYICGVWADASDTQNELYKVVNGNFTQLAPDDETNFQAGMTLTSSSNGSAISCKRNGSTIIGPVTDTSIPSGTRGGIGFKADTTATSSVTINNFNFGDISASGGSIGGLRRRHG